MRFRKITLLIFFTLVSVWVSSRLQAQTTYVNQVNFLRGEKKVSIPFHYVNHFIIVEVTIYGSIPLQLIFDTGAEHVIIFKRDYTDLLQVHYDKRIPIMGSDLSRQIYALITRNAMFQVSSLPAVTYDLLVLEEDYFNLEELIGTRVDGILGGGFFRNLIIQIDYRNQRLILHDPSYFLPPEDYTVLPIRVKTNKPYVDATASLQDGTVVSVDLLVDTGAGVPLLLHNNSHPSLKLPGHFIRGKLGMGLGGYLEGYIGRVPKLSVGNVDFPGILTSFQDIREEWLIDHDRFRNGILGNQLLSRFNVFLDYNRSQLMLKPYAKRQKPFVMDRSGMVIFAFGLDFHEFVVKELIPGSPAAEAGILPEDIIIQLQGLPTKYYSLDGVNRVLQKKVGKKIRMVLNRNGEKIRKEFLLRDLI